MSKGTEEKQTTNIIPGFLLRLLKVVRVEKYKPILHIFEDIRFILIISLAKQQNNTVQTVSKFTSKTFGIKLSFSVRL